jgi:hypothetical protein
MDAIPDDPIESSQSSDADDNENRDYADSEEPGREMQELGHHVRTRFK